MVPQNFVVLDLETTGLDPSRDEIIEIGAIKVLNGVAAAECHSLVKPSLPPNPQITELTGITPAMLDKAPPIEELWPSLRNFIGQLPVLGHNVRFDTSFLQAASSCEMPNQLFDTATLARVILPLFGSYALENLSTGLGLPHVSTHRALDDTRATLSLWEQLWHEVISWDILYTIEMARFASRVGWEYASLLWDHIESQKLVFPDSRTHQKHPNADASKTDISKTYVSKTDTFNVNEGLFASENRRISRETYGVTDLEAFLSEGGSVAQGINGYECRPQQLTMARAVWDAFSDGKILLMEAGTGTGKSLAYLLPSLLWSATSGEKVIIATNTINLQEQLWEKDLPLLRQALPFPFAAALLKGRHNYICLNRWENKISSPQVFDSPDFWVRLWRWLSLTSTGDMNELNLRAKQASLWHEVAATTETCLGSGCPWYSNRCFFHKSRREAEKADVVVINHSLLVADLQTSNHVLPASDYLVIDEAHHLEEVAMEHMGYYFAGNQLGRWLTGLERFLKNHLSSRLGRQTKEIKQSINEVLEKTPVVRAQGELLFKSLARWGSVAGKGEDEYSRLQVRITVAKIDLPTWHQVRVDADNLLLNLKILTDKAGKVLELLPTEEENLLGQPLRKELIFYISEGKGLTDNIEFILDLGSEDFVYWMDCDADGANIVLRAAPLNVGEMLKDILYQNKTSIVFTSATMTVGGDFTHFMKNSGLITLDENRKAYLQVDSPFSYDQQVLLCVPQDLPGPYLGEQKSFTREVSRFLTGLLHVTGGRTLVLFTSHKMLRAVYHSLKQPLAQQGIKLLGHGIDGGRTKLVEALRKGGQTVVFGASSFWEGVDIQGDNLSCVVVVKIPFAPPTQPTIEARLEQLEKLKKDPFRAFSLPHAVLRLRQGFGRLVRSRTDRGVVIILDNRVTGKKYGHAILNALPVCSCFKGTTPEILAKIKNWLATG